jgi:hypothetical protein
MKPNFLLLFLFLGFGAHPEVSAQTLNVVGQVPAYIDTDGMGADDLKYLEREFTVDVPLSSGMVKVLMGTAAGDSSVMVREFPLNEQRWADSTWVAPIAGGYRIGLGRSIGLDMVHVAVLNAGSPVGTGFWEE